jgi:hypothetical protein
MSQFIRQRLHILEKRDKPLFYIISNLSSFLFIWCGNLVEGRFKISLQSVKFNRVRMCVFWCSTFAYSVRFVLLVDCFCYNCVIDTKRWIWLYANPSSDPFQADDSIAPLIGRSLTSSTVGLGFVIMFSPESYLSLSFQHSKIQLRHQEATFYKMPVETSFSPSVSYHFQTLTFYLPCV